MNIIRSIQNRIYEIRGERVMLDRGFAHCTKQKPKLLTVP